jgi:chromodomain-helicase-DNA-binding protein 9
MPVLNMKDGSRLSGDSAPQLKSLAQWLSDHPDYVLGQSSFSLFNLSFPIPDLPSTSSQVNNKLKERKPELEPGEIAKDTSIAVVHRITGMLLPPNKSPTLRNLVQWLGKHPEYNVHSASTDVAKVCFN